YAGDELRGALRHRVDGVRAHRVAHVDDQVDDHVDAGGRVDQAGDDVEAAAAQLDEDGVDLVRGGDELLAALEDAGLRGLRGRDVDDLDLRLHDGAGRGGEEASRAVRPAGGVACRGDDGGLLRGHRHEYALAVDHQVRREAHRHAQHADDVLDEHVRGVAAQAVRGVERGQVRSVEAGPLDEPLPSL